MKLYLKLLLLATAVSLAACSDDDNNEEPQQEEEDLYIPGEVANDTTAKLDLSRGEYACYSMETTKGNVTLALDEKYAPITVANFDSYVSEGFYDNIIFHNVITEGFVQAGVVNPDLTIKETKDPIKSEQLNKLFNYRGRIAMMRTGGDYNSARAEFIIHVNNNHTFDYPYIGDGGGLTVFGGVVEGMAVIDEINNSDLKEEGNFPNLPEENILINSISKTSCPAESEELAASKEPKPLPYPVLEQDTAGIDLSRGDYACYQMVTSSGNIDLALDEKYAPATSANFAQYVTEEFFNDLIFHRVIDDFMIQGGGFNAEMTAKATNDAIDSEARNGLKNFRGRIAMARTQNPDSATSQFYINLVDNDFLDYSESGGVDGYTVFGEVIAGMDVVDAIGSVTTANHSSGHQNVPVTPITIDSVNAMACPQP